MNPSADEPSGTQTFPGADDWEAVKKFQPSDSDEKCQSHMEDDYGRALPLSDTHQTIIFHVLMPGVFVSQAHARATDQCGLLGRLFPQQATSFVYNGQLLDESLPLGFYGLKDMETIIALPKTNALLSRWVHISRDSDSFETSIKGLTSDATRLEAMRLRDLVLMKREMAPKKLHLATKRLPQVGGLSTTEHPTLIRPQPPTVSTERLPVLW
jgi:hypothetical protein